VHGRIVSAIVLGVLLILGVLGAGLAMNDSSYYPEGNAIVYDGDEPVATVNVTVADDSEERYVGLSEHDSLPADEGMLFVYEEERELTFVMRNMDFGIDIIYVDSEGCITGVNPAPEPGPDEVGENQRYPGEGQYVLEVNLGVASDNGVEAGDPVRFEYDGTVVDGTEADCFES